MLDTALPLNQPTYTVPPAPTTRSPTTTATSPLPNSGLEANNYDNPALTSGDRDFSAVTETGMAENSGMAE